MNLDSLGWPVGWICDGFKELCLTLSLGEDSRMAILRVMGDASGKKEKTNLAVGAYVSTANQWDRRLKPLWIAALQDEGFECFHRTDMEIPGHGEFDRADWIRERQISILNRLHKIIQDHTLHGQGHGVDAAAFEQSVPSQIKRDYGGIYGFCVLQTVRNIGAVAQLQDNWVHYIFEAGDEGQEQINIVMAKLMRDDRYRAFFRIADFTFGKKKGPCAIVQLQPADFIAFESYKRIESYLYGEIRDPRKSFVKLLRPEHDFVKLWTGESIEAWVAHVNEHKGDVMKSMITRVSPERRISPKRVLS